MLAAMSRCGSRVAASAITQYSWPAGIDRFRALRARQDPAAGRKDARHANEVAGLDAGCPQRQLERGELLAVTADALRQKQALGHETQHATSRSSHTCPGRRSRFSSSHRSPLAPIGSPSRQSAQRWRPGPMRFSARTGSPAPAAATAPAHAASAAARPMPKPDPPCGSSTTAFAPPHRPMPRPVIGPCPIGPIPFPSRHVTSPFVVQHTRGLTTDPFVAVLALARSPDPPPSELVLPAATPGHRQRGGRTACPRRTPSRPRRSHPPRTRGPSRHGR